MPLTQLRTFAGWPTCRSRLALARGGWGLIPHYRAPTDANEPQEAVAAAADAEHDSEPDSDDDAADGPQDSGAATQAQSRRALKRARKLERIEANKARRKATRVSRNQRASKVQASQSQTAHKPVYVVSHGLRRIQPYVRELQTNAKGRWVGRTLADVFTAEFTAFDREQYVREINAGLIVVNGRHQSPDYVVKNGDVVVHKVHYHEAPVTTEPIRILKLTDDIVVVDKPPTIPVHSGGAYSACSLLGLLREEHNLGKLYPIHRLDRITSGVIVIGRSPTAARDLSKSLQTGGMSKTYFARVQGCLRIPTTPEGVAALPSGVQPWGAWLCVTKPMDRGVKFTTYACCDDGKPAETWIAPVWSDGKETIVIARPVTGRTHQIRVHLAYLGCPIVNDPVYNPAYVITPVPTQALGPVDTTEHKTDDAESLVIQLCPCCSRGEPAAFNDEQLYYRGLWLHSYRYKTVDWSVTAHVPDWVAQHVTINEEWDVPPLPDRVAGLIVMADDDEQEHEPPADRAAD